MKDLSQESSGTRIQVHAVKSPQFMEVLKLGQGVERWLVQRLTMIQTQRDNLAMVPNEGLSRLLFAATPFFIHWSQSLKTHASCAVSSETFWCLVGLAAEERPQLC